MKKSHWRQNSNRPGHGWARRNKSRGRRVTHSLHSCITATRAIDHQTMRVPVGSHPVLVGSCTWNIIIAIEENCRVVNILAQRHFHRSGATLDWRGETVHLSLFVFEQVLLRPIMFIWCSLFNCNRIKSRGWKLFWPWVAGVERNLPRPRSID